jgi:hypothetical protein
VSVLFSLRWLLLLALVGVVAWMTWVVRHDPS